MFIATNNGNIITYDLNNSTNFDFLYLDFDKNYGDIRNITRQSNTNNFYFTGDDGLYTFDINDFNYIGVGNKYSNTISGTYAVDKIPINRMKMGVGISGTLWVQGAESKTRRC